MAQPKTHINDPTYTHEDAAKLLGITPQQLSKIVEGPEYNWITMAKLVIARKLWKTLPLQLISTDTWQRIAVLILGGPTPRAGTVRIRPDGTVVYIAKGLEVLAKDGIHMHWDGMLKV